MTRLLVVRHAQSEWNAAGRWQGWGDPPLSAPGRDQASRAAEALGDFRGAVASSDLRRAFETAQIVAERLGLARVEVERDLREIDVGEWTGLTREEIERRFPGMLAEWRAGRLERPAGGERRAELLERVLGALERLADRHAGEDVLVVTHAGVIHAIERHLGAVEAVSTANLSGRWLEAASPLRVIGGRLDLLPEPS